MNNSPSAPSETDKEAEENLVKKLEPLVKPGKAQQVAQLLEMTVSRYHSGPLPPPEDFAGYENVHPGTAERILAMAERAQAHRHKQESRTVIGEYGIRIMGQVGALMTIALLVALVGYCAYLKQPLAAGVVAAIGGVAGYFLHRGGKRDEPEGNQRPSKQQARRKK